MKKLRVILVALAVGIGAVAIAPTMAQASSGSVSIKTIASPKVSKGHKATIRPSVSAKGQVSVKSKALTVYQGKKRIVNNKASASLGVGSYKVTTTVKYQTYTYKTVTKTKQVKKTGVAAGGSASTTCTVTKVIKSVNTPISLSTLTGLKLPAKGTLAELTCTGTSFDTVKVSSALLLKGTTGWVGYGVSDLSNPLANLNLVFDFRGKAPVQSSLSTGTKLTGQIYTIKGLTKTVTVSYKETIKVWSSTKTATKTQSLSVKQR